MQSQCESCKISHFFSPKTEKLLGFRCLQGLHKIFVGFVHLSSDHCALVHVNTKRIRSGQRNHSSCQVEL